jgi:uncharacterized protein YbaR (Trm112 family)
MADSSGFRCPVCDSEALISIQSAAVDSELLECEFCKRVYEVKYLADGTPRLVSV